MCIETNEKQENKYCILCNRTLCYLLYSALCLYIYVFCFTSNDMINVSCFYNSLIWMICRECLYMNLTFSSKKQTNISVSNSDHGISMDDNNEPCLTVVISSWAWLRLNQFHSPMKAMRCS